MANFGKPVRRMGPGAVRYFVAGVEKVRRDLQRGHERGATAILKWRPGNVSNCDNQKTQATIAITQQYDIGVIVVHSLPFSTARVREISRTASVRHGDGRAGASGPDLRFFYPRTGFSALHMLVSNDAVKLLDATFINPRRSHACNETASLMKPPHAPDLDF